jgi:hypothetical protein
LLAAFAYRVRTPSCLITTREPMAWLEVTVDPLVIGAIFMAR